MGGRAGTGELGDRADGSKALTDNHTTAGGNEPGRKETTQRTVLYLISDRRKQSAVMVDPTALEGTHFYDEEADVEIVVDRVADPQSHGDGDAVVRLRRPDGSTSWLHYIEVLLRAEDRYQHVDAAQAAD